MNVFQYNSILHRKRNTFQTCWLEVLEGSLRYGRNCTSLDPFDLDLVSQAWAVGHLSKRNALTLKYAMSSGTSVCFLFLYALGIDAQRINPDPFYIVTFGQLGKIHEPFMA